MKTTIKEAKQEKVFYFNQNGEIEEYNLYDFVMDHAEETTSPRGVEPKLHIRDKHEWTTEGEQLNEKPFEVWTWGTRGQHPKIIEAFETEDEAKEHIFQLTYQYDVLESDQVGIYFSSREEAEEYQ